MVVDVVTYNGEKELFDLRYNILKDYVDEFIVVEFDKTFSGNKKSFYSDKLIKSKYKKLAIYQCNESDYKKYFENAKKSPNTEYGKGAGHWIMEWSQKEFIKDCLEYERLKDDDTVFIGDCDEIWDPNYKHRLYPVKLKLRVYTYYLNNRSSESFNGTFYGTYGSLKMFSDLNEARTKAKKIQPYAGWHFTSLKDNLRQKLTDSYTEETYATKAVLDNLDKNIEENKDFLGRDFKYWIDESDWPTYLKENKEKYIKLCKSLT